MLDNRDSSLTVGPFSDEVTLVFIDHEQSIDTDARYASGREEVEEVCDKNGDHYIIITLGVSIIQESQEILQRNNIHRRRTQANDPSQYGKGLGYSFTYFEQHSS